MRPFFAAEKIMRQSLVVANWKMNGSTPFVESFSAELGAANLSNTGTRVVVCPPYPYLQRAVQSFAESVVEIGSQDVSGHETGAYTGEVSADMLSDLGANWVIVGHSERRAYHAETDELVVSKAAIAMNAGLTPICCVGETLEDREFGQTEAVVGGQIRALVDAFEPTGQLKNLVIAYEPVWAIGTGKTATPEEAQAVHSFIRGLLGENSADICILYGGSVKSGNAEELFSQPDIDGGLIGGASLVPQEFIEICQSAT